MKSSARLIAAVEAAIRKLKAQRPSGETLGSKAPAQPQAAPAAHFGEHERLEESKYYPPAPSEALRADELPDSYGKTRVVLLVVDPNLVHAYWEVTPREQSEAESRIGDSSQPVLRFYEAAESFDVEIDLRPRNWYVPLWSSGKSYYVDLGLRGGSGSFARLARSNAVHVPRALPVIEVEERFMRVEAPAQRAEIITPPPYRKPIRPQGLRQSPVLRTMPAAAAPYGNPEVMIDLRGEPALQNPGNSSEILRRKLEEFYALRDEPLKPEEAPATEANGFEAQRHHPDLTELAETHQAMGLSSASLHQGRPER